MSTEHSPQSFIKNQNGSLIILAMIGLSVLSGAFYYSLSHLKQTQNHLRTVVIKQQMIAAESRLNNLLMQPTSYKIIPPSKSAVLDEQVLEQFKIFVPGARCKTDEAFCGIKITQLKVNNNIVPYWNSSASRFSGSLVYTGLEVVVAPFKIEIEIPSEVLQLQKYFCPSDSPFLAGFEENGNLICKPLPAPNACDGRGDFIKKVNSNLTVECDNFGRIIECPDDSFISAPGPTWNGTDWISPGCSPRLDPYSNPDLRP